MAAPKGNQCWMLRLKHGLDGRFKTPEEIWENFVQYVQWAEETPLIEVDFRGKDATEVNLPKKRLLTKEGFALACGFASWATLAVYKSKSKDFAQVFTRIEQAIYTSKLEGAASGLFNHNIIARDLGLMNQEQVNMQVVEVIKPKPNKKGSEQEADAEG
jgi:DNA-packaging protein gp3